MVTALQLPRIQAAKISDSAYEILRERVVSKELAPDQRLDLHSIEQQLGISRTPLKEALVRLEIDGLVRIVPRSGTFVTNPDRQDIMESFDVRRVLEVHAVSLAAERASAEELQVLQDIVDELGQLVQAPNRTAIYPRYLKLDRDLHGRIVTLAGNRRLRLSHSRENLHAQMARIRYRRAERELETAQHEHERIMDALMARDAEAAKAAMDAHLQRAARSLLRDMDV